MVPQADLDFLGAAAPAANVQPLQRAALAYLRACDPDLQPLAC